MKNDPIRLLLTPSWLSGLIAVTAGLAVSVGIILIFVFNNSQLHQQIAEYQVIASQPTLTVPGQSLPAADNNSLQTTWPLMAFWAIVGLGAYVIGEYIVKAVQEAAAFKNELNYVHVRRRQLLKTTAEYLIFRLAVVAVWLLFIDLFFKRVIPYCVMAAQAASGSPDLLNTVAYGLLAFIMMAGSLHLHAIFMRLTFRRARLFSA